MSVLTATQARARIEEMLTQEAAGRPDLAATERENPLLVLLANLFGAEQVYAETEAGVATSSATLATVQTIATPASFPGGLVRVDWHVLAAVSALTANVRVRVDLDATSDTSADGTEFLDVLMTPAGTTNPSLPVCGFRCGSLPAGVHTVRLKVARVGTGTVTVSQRRLAGVRVA